MNIVRHLPSFMTRIIYLVFIIASAFVIVNDYFFTNSLFFRFARENPIVFGISIVEEVSSSTQGSTQSPSQDNEWATYLALQSQESNAQVFLDYISLPDDTDILPPICFDSIHLSKNTKIPTGAISDFSSDNALGELKQFNYAYPNEYVFEFKETLCLEKGKKFMLPHLFLGIIPAETYADFGIARINGERSFDFFPLDKQQFVFNVTARLVDGAKSEYVILPSLDVYFLQQEWVGAFEINPNGELVLQLQRPQFYKSILLALLIGVLATIFLINNFFEKSALSLEAIFILISGIWGVRQIVVPEYIGNSILVDFFLYVLIIFFVAEVLGVYLDDFISKNEKKKLRIIGINQEGIEQEFIEIENRSLFPVEMSNWLLYDAQGNGFKFPLFVISGKKYFTGKTSKIRIWTKGGLNDNSNLHWGRKESIWVKNNIAYLEDNTGEVISKFAASSIEAASQFTQFLVNRKVAQQSVQRTAATPRKASTKSKATKAAKSRRR